MKGTNFFMGLIMAAIFTAIIMLLPHKAFRVQGMESDLGYYYVPMARELATQLFDEPEYAPRHYTWSFHGPVYPMMLLLGRKTVGPDTEEGYFIIAKWISALAGGSVILLAFLWLGTNAGLLAALSLGLTYLFVECSFSCGTDLVSVAFILWCGFWLKQKSMGWVSLLLCGLLFAFAVDMRHEFIVLLPFVLFYLWKTARTIPGKPWHHWRYTLRAVYFLIPFVLLILPDMPAWNGTYNAAFKYKADDARWQDLWPKEAFTEENTDDISETYWGYLIRKSGEQYPSLLSVLADDPLKNLSIWTRDMVRGCKDIPAVWVLPFLSIGLVLYLVSEEKDGHWKLHTKIFAIAVLFHYFMINSFGVYVDRYYLLQVIIVTFAGSAAFFKLIPTNWKGTLALLITIPFLYLGLLETQKAISRNVGFGGERYRYYSEIVLPEAGQHHAVLMSRDPGIPVVAGADWHQFPKGVTDLHRYCLERGVRYIYWGSKEAIFRSEYAPLFDSPDQIGPEYSVVDRQYGILYYVNELEHL